MHKILIADDNTDIVEILSKYIKKEGYEPIIAKNGLDALTKFETESPILLLLDVMMPFKNGFEVCHEIRRSSDVPIIMITSKSADHDKILGLNTGADDYVVKPFSPKEVMARISALLRRTKVENPNSKTLSISNLHVNIESYLVSIDDQTINLTKKELEILWLLATNKNKVFTRENLLNSIWGIDYEGDDRTVDTNIKRLRKKLNTLTHPNWDLITVWGVGYKFEVHHV